MNPIYQIRKIEYISKKINEPKQDFSFGENKYNIQSSIELKIRAQDKMIIPIVYIAVSDAKDNEEIIAEFKIAFLYTIENFDDFAKLDQNSKYTVDDDLAINLNTISISTARGMLFTEVQGTYLKDFLMPIVYFTQIPAISAEKE